MNLPGVFLRGLLMGAADIVPGVSGGTVAFITGIYERMIGAIKSFDVTAVKLLLSGKVKEFAKHTDFTAEITRDIVFKVDQSFQLSCHPC